MRNIGYADRPPAGLFCPADRRICNRWVDSYLSALLGAGLSTEHFKTAAEQKEVAEDDADANIAAKYYVNQILNLDEESIQQAWLKVGAGPGPGAQRVQQI